MKTDWQFNVMHAGPTIPGRDELIRALEALGGEVTTSEINESFTVHILEGSENFDAVVELLEEAERQKRIGLMILHHVTYNEKERSAARWLHVYSANMRYDKGESEGVFELQHLNGIHVDRIETYWGQVFEQKVREYGHCVQIGPIYTKWKPNWRPERQFCTSMFCTLFCSDEAKRVMEEAELKGVTFRPVLLPKRETPVEDLWQVWPQETADFLAPGKYVECRPCKTCGEMRYIPQGGRAELLIREDRIPRDLDFMQTPPSYGASAGMPYYVISARAYQVLKDAKITRGLVFTPLDVVKPTEE